MAYKKWGRLTKEQTAKYKEIFLEAYEKSHGLLLKSCDETGIPHDKIYKWQNEDADFKQRMDDIKKATEDFVVGELYKAIERGNVASMMFLLKCKYHWKETSKVEVDTPNNIDVQAVLNEIKQQYKK